LLFIFTRTRNLLLTADVFLSAHFSALRLKFELPRSFVFLANALQAQLFGTARFDFSLAGRSLLFALALDTNFFSAARLFFLDAPLLCRSECSFFRGTFVAALWGGRGDGSIPDRRRDLRYRLLCAHHVAIRLVLGSELSPEWF
jgi:hypothetical protein